ncbi:hypothetical protein [Vibrio bivalvicida]|uniref:Uncharacterized protein n=1 Tax=Vibrio bivalvicida TaxID=1276888 RepID=A0ABV4MLH2_9VIBR
MIKWLRFLSVFLFSIPLTLSAKELPDMESIVKRLDTSGVTLSDQWQLLDDGVKQTVPGGVLFITPKAVMSMMTVSGKDVDELTISYSMAGIHCVKSSLEAIDMGHNKSLPKSMYESFSNALKAPTQKASTLVWGYRFETEVARVKEGLIVSCSLQ